MFPDWSKAPEWANFCAMDNDGSRWWFEKEPQLVGGNYMAEPGSQSALICDCEPFMWARPASFARMVVDAAVKTAAVPQWGLPASKA